MLNYLTAPHPDAPPKGPIFDGHHPSKGGIESNASVNARQPDASDDAQEPAQIIDLFTTAQFAVELEPESISRSLADPDRPRTATEHKRSSILLAWIAALVGLILLVDRLLQ